MERVIEELMKAFGATFGFEMQMAEGIVQI
jgi:hypothetical protein